MRILAALFIDELNLRQVPGPSTRIDLTGIKFSEPAPATVPVTVTPHLIVLVHCPPEEKGEAALEVVYHRDGEQIARNLQMVAVEPGKFNYRLVRADLEFDEYGTVEASCRIDGGPPVVVPYTLLPPTADADPRAIERLRDAPTMTFAAAISEHPDVRQAAGEVVGELLERIGAGADLAVLFVTTAHRDAIGDVARVVRRLLRPETLIGAAASSVVGGDREVEDTSAVVLWAARLPAPVTPVRLDAISGPEGWVFTGLPDTTPGDHIVVLADPFSFPVDAFVEDTNEPLASVRVIGGLASAAHGPGGNRLVLDGAVHDDGAVGVVLPAGSGATTLVSQGCRPIGTPMVVTRAEERVVYELAGKPALDRLADVVGGLSDHERSLAMNGLHVGWVIDEHKEEFERGDFLIRNLLGGSRDVGALVVGAPMEVGSTIQFQVRDAASADEDLRLLLAGRRASGALVFTCNGRGSRLFGRPGHDAELVDALTGGATAGMFCAGEVGPVGGRSFVHGFTASILLFP